MLELSHVHKSYKKHPAVIDVSFSMGPGEIVGMVGPNGAGKSTTVSMIATLLRPDTGTILFHGQDISKDPAAIRRHLGYVPQDITLYESLTGMDNMLFWAKAYHIERTMIQGQIEKICDMIGFSEEVLKKRVKEYSGGMKRRLNIGVALLHEPDLIILDEPAVGIDLQSRKQIFLAIRKLKQEGKSILYIGHYMEEVEQLCDRILLMKEGRCILDQKIEDALSNQGNPITLEQLYERMNIDH